MGASSEGRILQTHAHTRTKAHTHTLGQTPMVEMRRAEGLTVVKTRVWVNE